MGIMTAKFIKDVAAVNAVEILMEYCKDGECKNCVFNWNDYCQFRDSQKAPVYWDIPADYKED